MKEISSNNNKVKEKWKKKLKDNGDAGKALRIQCETRKNSANQNQKFKKKIDMKEVQCYCYQRFGHYARDCYFNKDNGDDKGMAQLAHAGNSDAEKFILIAATHFPSDKENVWHLDTCSNNHMTGNRN